MTILIRKIEPGRMPPNILIPTATKCLPARRRMAERIRIMLTTLVGIGQLAPTKVCIPSAATRAPRHKSVFPTETVAVMAPGTRHILPGAAARRLCRPLTAWACSIALQPINNFSGALEVRNSYSTTKSRCEFLIAEHRLSRGLDFYKGMIRSLVAI
jgi:hypothetical protein